MKNIIILFSIIALGSFLRLYNFGNVPPSPNWDEVSLGYNAYSILLTSKDEYGEFLPVVIRSFDDYKPALYTYLVIPFIPIFDLTVQAVRLPSAISGIIMIIVTYFLAQELFQSIKIKRTNATKIIALLSALTVAISPWGIQFSRQAFESNVGATLNAASLLFFLKSLKNPKYLVLSFALGALNIHIYQSNRVFTPLMLLGLSVIHAKEMFKFKKYYITAALVAILITIPLVIFVTTNQNALLRAKGVSIFSSQELLNQSAQRNLINKEQNNTLGLILDNRRVEFAKQSLAGYISHFDFNWLYLTGDISRHHAPNIGLMYITLLPFLLIGFYHLAFSKYNTKKKLAYFTYLLLVPIPAMITTGIPHAVRTLNFVPIFQIATATGLAASYIYLTSLNSYKKYLSYTGVFLISVMFALNFGYYLNQYFIQLNLKTSKDWLYGYEKTVQATESLKKGYDQVIVSNEVPLDQSYMFFLFYTKFNPQKYQDLGGTKSGGFAETHRGFDKYKFRPIDYEKESSNSLLVGRPQDFPDEAKILTQVNYLDGKPAILVVER